MEKKTSDSMKTKKAAAPAKVKAPGGSLRTKTFAMDIIVHTILILMAVIWLIPFVYLVAQSFRGGNNLSIISKSFFPEEWTFDNYKKLLTDTSVLNFPQIFTNTLIVAVCSCLISSFFVLAVSYCMSRLKWKLRKPYMNMAMVITLFPGFMSMTATYFLLKGFGLTPGSEMPEFFATLFPTEEAWNASERVRTMAALIICYSSGAGVGFYVMKGYMDTIPKSLDEAAYLDGATKWQTFIKITLPLCKPMIVYQLITSFMGPWCDFVFAKLIVRSNSQYLTVASGLQQMMTMEYSNLWFTRFCAGAVMIAIPITLLYILTQKFYQEAMSGAVKG